ncbi:hypothetical protein C8Q78DRAFT_34470 [Trametes maxima]|nr:hypothetical protein C8Q78DRAFT_34470 [Trametes maxima]
MGRWMREGRFPTGGGCVGRGWRPPLCTFFARRHRSDRGREPGALSLESGEDEYPSSLSSSGSAKCSTRFHSSTSIVVSVSIVSIILRYPLAPACFSLDHHCSGSLARCSPRSSCKTCMDFRSLVILVYLVLVAGGCVVGGWRPSFCTSSCRSHRVWTPKTGYSTEDLSRRPPLRRVSFNNRLDCLGCDGR